MGWLCTVLVSTCSHQHSLHWRLIPKQTHWRDTAREKKQNALTFSHHGKEKKKDIGYQLWAQRRKPKTKSMTTLLRQQAYAFSPPPKKKEIKEVTICHCTQRWLVCFVYSFMYIRKVFKLMIHMFIWKDFLLLKHVLFANIYRWHIYALSVLLYAFETWTLDADCLEHMIAFEMWIYRWVLTTPWSAKISNKMSKTA